MNSKYAKGSVNSVASTPHSASSDEIAADDKRAGGSAAPPPSSSMPRAGASLDVAARTDGFVAGRTVRKHQPASPSALVQNDLSGDDGVSGDAKGDSSSGGGGGWAPSGREIVFRYCELQSKCTLSLEFSI